MTLSLVCKHCSSERKNANSLRNHERTCPKNPDRQLTFFAKERKALNKTQSNQYIKAKELSLPAPAVSNETRLKQREKNLARSDEWNKTNGRRISETINKKVEDGTWHTSLTRRMHYEYKGVDLHGKWELNYARHLDENGIEWERCKKSFPYVLEDKARRYTPDFYLPATNEYVEVKGYKTDKDEAKWSQFPASEKLVILMKKELQNLGIDVR